ncbi:MAG: NAD(P)H-dependent oxidoreductase [Saprospiraceae bacterium]
MKKVLILFAHPRFENSRIHRSLLWHIRELPCVTLHDLYEEYPHFNIDVAREKEILQAHDIIVWQHPIYWYNCPALLKQWIDLSLEYGWAYGPGGDALSGKWIFNVVSSGGLRQAYSEEGRHGHTLREFLLPFEQTAKLCKMRYLPPFAAQGAHQIDHESLQTLGQTYAQLIRFLTLLDREDALSALEGFPLMNDIPDLMSEKAATQ